MLKIFTEPNAILHQKCRKVADFDDKLKKLAQDMVETLRSNKGIGLAAPQIGKLIRLIVIEFEPDKFSEEEKAKTKIKSKDKIPLTILINPKITKLAKETSISPEGCLSLPGREIPVARPVKANVLAKDLTGKRLKIRAKGLFARILQHEIDHLSGILITDRMIKSKNKK